MREQTVIASPAELKPLLELTEYAGNDSLLTQGSTGNSSAKLDGVLWIKSSGSWMADAMRDDILIPLDLETVVTNCLRQGVDPAERFPSASLETAMHAVLPHPVVLHVHCVNTIAWAVRSDAPLQLQRRLEGLRWRWLPYVASGLPLSVEMEHALSARPDTNVFVLGNHGLVIGGNDAQRVKDLLNDVTQRLAIPPRQADLPDFEALREISKDSPWEVPEDQEVHFLGTDAISGSILARGLLYPCQAIFSGSRTTELFRSIPYPSPGTNWRSQYSDRPFLIIEGRGVVVRKSMTPAEVAMISGLAQVVRRIGASASLRYLSAAELAGFSSQTAYRYRAIASATNGNRNR